MFRTFHLTGGFFQWPTLHPSLPSESDMVNLSTFLSCLSEGWSSGGGEGGGRNRAWALVAMLSQPSLRPPYFFVHMRFRWFYNICTRAQHKSTDKNLNDWFASCKRIASISFKGMYGKLLLHPIPLGWTGFLLVVLQLPRKFKTLCIMTNWRWDICASRLPSTISRCVHGQCPTFLPH